MLPDLSIVGLLKKVEHVGFTIYPYLYEPSDNPYITPVERINPLNISSLEYIPEGGRELYEISQQLEPANLLKQFSAKKVSMARFFEEKPQIINEFVKPFIDRKLSECIELLNKYRIPLYYSASMPHLYPADRINIEARKAQTTLRFERTENATFYHLEAYIGNRKLDLQSEGNYLLSNQPCCLVYKNRLISFERNITGKLLEPFLTKDCIEIPKRLENKYFSTFIRKIIDTSEIVATGFTINDLSVSPTALLSYEKDWQGRYCLVLKFNYGEKIILAGNPQKSFTDLKTDESGFVFYRYKRLKHWEELQKEFLKSLGLTPFESIFRICSDDSTSNEYELIEWLIKNADILKEANFTIVQDPLKEFILHEPEVRHEAIEHSDWFDLNIIISAGDVSIHFSEIHRYIRNRQREYPLGNGKYFLIPSAWFEQYEQLLVHADVTGDTLKVSRHHYLLLAPFDLKVVTGFTTLSKPLDTDVPLLANVTLRPYQITGFKWLKQLSDLGFGGILADDMGLGKTVQTIALLASYYQKSEVEINPSFPEKNDVKNAIVNTVQLDLFSQPEPLPVAKKQEVSSTPARPCSMLVMPASLIHNWANELNRFAPFLKAYIYTGTTRKKSTSQFRKYDLLLTTYGTLRNDIEFLKQYKFAYCILDESQQIKNPSSKTAQAVSEIHTEHRFVLTGTPVENNLTDLWSQMNFINPGLLGNQSTFHSYYANPVAKNPDSTQGEKLLSMIEPFILRRTKESVAPELPDLLETISYCTMTEEQQELYESEKSKVRNLIFDQLENIGQSASPIMVLKALMQLRQIANHPRMVHPESEIESGKFEEVTGKLQTIIEENHRVLIFSSFVRHLNLFEEHCRIMGYKYAMLTGSTRNREQVVEGFTNDEEVKIFLISMKAGGVGLNLTKADYVFMLDPWWNPAAEMQAVNRAHRIGQDKNVFVYRFITKDSIEEKILKLQEKKKALAETFVRPQEIISGLTREELLKLFE